MLRSTRRDVTIPGVGEMTETTHHWPDGSVAGVALRWRNGAPPPGPRGSAGRAGRAARAVVLIVAAAALVAAGSVAMPR